MRSVLIVYGTTDGHTRKIASVMAGILELEGLSAEVADAASPRPAHPAGYDGVIVAASVHVRGYQSAVGRWIRRHAPTIQSRPGVFVSVCLGVLNPDQKAQREVRRIPADFLRARGWRPSATRVIAGALPYTRYGWLKKQVMRRIAGRAGGGTDIHRDYDYTDWQEVRRIAREFAALVRPASPAVAACALSLEGGGT